MEEMQTATTSEQNLSPVEQLQPAVLMEMVREVAPSLEIPSRPLFGVLPIRRLVPQDVHAIGDYTTGLLCAGTLFAGDTRAQAAGAALSASIVGVSLMTDYRLSVANVIPIEVHEVLDYLWGASAIAAPFVLGYHKRSPVAAALHIAAGAATILEALFTDYRAAKGRGRSKVESAALMGAATQPGVSKHMDYGESGDVRSGR